MAREQLKPFQFHFPCLCHSKQSQIIFIYLSEIPIEIQRYKLESTHTNKHTLCTKREKEATQFFKLSHSTLKIRFGRQHTNSQDFTQHFLLYWETSILGSDTNCHDPTNRLVRAPTLIHLYRRTLTTHFKIHVEVINSFN